MAIEITAIDMDMDMDTISTRMKNNSEKCIRTDLHTHILPGIDDGAEHLESSLNMLRILKIKGVERVALTPHFYPMREELSVFFDRRAQAYDALFSAWDEQTMPQLRLGAEVRYTPKIAELDLQQLAIGQGNYLLLELPDMGVAALLDSVIESILNQGITPIFAHVERCTLFRNEPNLLLEFVQKGVLAQISAEALVGKSDSFAEACLQNGLAQIISSDIHNLKDRCCFFDAAAAEKYAEIIRWAEGFARAVWDNTPLPAFAIRPVKKGLLGYR